MFGLIPFRTNGVDKRGGKFENGELHINLPKLAQTISEGNKILIE